MSEPSVAGNPSELPQAETPARRWRRLRLRRPARSRGPSRGRPPGPPQPWSTAAGLGEPSPRTSSGTVTTCGAEAAPRSSSATTAARSTASAPGRHGSGACNLERTKRAPVERARLQNRSFEAAGVRPAVSVPGVRAAPIAGERREAPRRDATLSTSVVTEGADRGRLLRPLRLLGLAGALAVAVALRLSALLGARRPAPIISRDELLPDDPDLLRQLDAAHRPCLHHGRGGHPRAPSPPARRGDLLPDRGGRACGQGRAGRRRAGARAEGIHRPDRRRLAGAAATAERVDRLLHPDER